MSVRGIEVIDESTNDIRVEKFDYTALENVPPKADAIVNKCDEADIVTFSDGGDNLPLKSLVLNLEPHQEGEGDPSPDNVRPITGWDIVSITRCGKNFLQDVVHPIPESETTISGVSIIRKGDGSIVINGTSTANITYYLSRRDGASSNQTIFLPKGRFIMSGIPSNSTGLRLGLNRGNNSATIGSDYGMGYQFIEENGKMNYSVWIGINSGNTYDNVVIKPMIRFASDIDAIYEPYQGTVFPISLSSVGTVYKGILDVTKGILTVYWEIVKFSDLTWSYTNWNNIPCFSSRSIRGKAIWNTGMYVLPNLKCSIYTRYTRSQLYDNDYIGICYANNAKNPDVIVRDSRYTDLQTFLEATKDGQLLYELENPETYQLTPTEIASLLGDNTLYMDADGTISAEYRADTKLYIDALTIPDSDMIADSNIASGKYFTVNNKLYLSTAAIAAGETIVPGTNCTETDLATALNIIKEA